jgi:YHS domain-containing protein
MKTILLIAALLLVATLAFAEGVPQTTCPVMKGMKVDSNSQYVDVEGYRIYVCCGSCVFDVQDNPSKYIAQMKAEGIELEKAPAE